MNRKLSSLDDVVNLIEEEDMPFESRTFIIEEFFAKIQAHTALGDDWMTNGVNCRYLAPNRNWRRGKVKLELTFIPYEDENEGE